MEHTTDRTKDSGPKKKPGRNSPGPGHPDKTKAQEEALHRHPDEGERSDRDAIGRPVQLDEDPGRRQPPHSAERDAGKR